MSKAVKKIGKAVGNVAKAVGKVVKAVAPIAAPILAIALPGIGTAIGTALGATGTAASALGGAVIGAAGSAIGGKNVLTGALLGGLAGAAGGLLGGGEATFDAAASGAQSGGGLLSGTGPLGMEGALGTGLTSGSVGLQLPTAPALASMGGGTGLVAPTVAGDLITAAGLTGASAVPVLGEASSMINAPQVVGSTIAEPASMGGLGSGLQTPTIGGIESTTGLEGVMAPTETVPSIGLTQPTTPALASMGGGTGLLAPTAEGIVGATGLTAAGAVPMLGDAASFINSPQVLGTPVIGAQAPSTISLSDAFRAARTINSLMNQPQQPQIDPYMLMQQQQQAGLVDYSQLLSLLAARRPMQTSLLG